MPLTILGIAFGILISSLWVFLPLKRVPDDIRLEKGKYIGSIIIGATVCTLVIAIFEVSFDDITGIDIKSLTTVPRALIYAVIRSALIEEIIKFYFVKRRLQKVKPIGKLQYMLISGAIGMGYGIIEKALLGSAVAMLFDVLFSLHVVFQFLMGAYLYRADQTDDKKQKRILNIKAFAVPFILHSVWDSVLFGGTINLDADNMNAEGVILILIILVTVAAAVAGEIKMIIHLKKTDVSEGLPDDTPETPETAEAEDTIVTEDESQNHESE